MKGFLNATVLASALLWFPSVLLASPSAYICIITDYSFHEDNQEVRATLERLAKGDMKTILTIDRRTGAVIHPALGNTAFPFITVLDHGSEEFSFIAMAWNKVRGDRSNGVVVRYYEVAEFDEGPRKSFMMIADGRAYTGYCE